ncbi:flagellin [Frateuria sp. GZRR35]|uniref:flagellin N-terminal helical domain-containing protein n=1 Tax=Frateuria sp. GZRR35 TaxID=3351536 RepID=UPI003EDB8C58
MVMSVNTNISSLNAQNNLAKSQSKLSTAIERLSSGMKINSAKDDAAGLAISTRFTTQINGLNQAVSNANDGISLAQTTESALNEVTNNMQRIRTLAVQSANATNSDSDRQALDAEVQQRLAEITRIAQQTTFNGRHVLDGSFGSAAFQIGANVGETISVNLSQGAGAKQVGQIAQSSTGDISAKFATAGSAAVPGTKASFTTDAITPGANLTGKSFDIDGTTVNLGDYTGDADNSNLISDISGALGSGYTVTDAGSNKIKIEKATASDGAITVADTDTVVGTGTSVTGVADVAAVPASSELSLVDGDLTINGTEMTGTYKDAQSLVDAINAKGITGVSAYYDSETKSVHLNSQDDLTVDGAKAGAGELNFSGAGTTPISAGSNLAASDVKTVAGANDTISRIDSALSTISSMRSDLGAVQNRFSSTIANLQTISQNLSASRSQIQDADFAAETANMSSANILQQAGVSVLAQANSTTQSVLKLLQ